MSNPQTETVRLGRRVCRYCRRPYRAPVGSKRDGCTDCAPRFDDLADEAERVRADVERAHATGDGIPF